MLRVIVVNRLESGKQRNLKISLMITAAIGFCIYTTSGLSTVTEYFRDVWLWYIGADLFIGQNLVNSGYLNEVPMAAYLDSKMIGKNPDVLGYIFTSAGLSTMLGDEGESRFFVKDYSDAKSTPVSIYGVSSQYRDVTREQFYIPSEVQG